MAPRAEGVRPQSPSETPHVPPPLRGVAAIMRHRSCLVKNITDTRRRIGLAIRVGDARRDAQNAGLMTGDPIIRLQTFLA